MAAVSGPTDATDQDTVSPLGNHDATQTQQQHEDPNQDPQSPFGKFLTLEPADPRSPHAVDEADPQDRQAEPEAEPEPEPEPSVEECREEEDDREMTPSFSAPMPEVHVISSSSSFSRRGGGPRRKKGNHKKRAAEKKSQEKLKVLVETLKPIPFTPVRTLDLSAHEKLLKRLGLWDFVHLEFDRSIRCDLVAQLIASYNSMSRCSYVNGSRINVSRADLARALKLPVKKERLTISDEEKDILASEESMKFLEEFISTSVLLQGEDTWMMPDEVVEWKKSIKERHFEKLDWAGLFWFMVEKELTAAPQLCDCYYASHMQCLIKSQKEELLTEELKNEEESDVKEVEVQEDEDVSGDVNMADRIEVLKEERGLEEHNIELNLGQESVSKTISEGEQARMEQVMDFKENKERAEEGWIWSSNSNVGQHFLRPCASASHVNVMECDSRKEMDENERTNNVEEEDEEVEEEAEKHEGGFPLFPDNDTLEGVPHENIITEMDDGSPIAFSSGMQLRDTSTAEFLGSRADIHMIPGSSSIFSGSNKREIDHENDISHHAHAGNKRFRTEEPSWNDKPSDFDVCLEHMQHWIEKARLSYAEKERGVAESNFNQQMLLNELQRKEGMIQHLQKVQYEELHRKDMEIYKLETDLRLMVNVLDGYRKALKKTQQAYKEHGEYCQMRDEPLYKDVKGSRGLVLSAVEVERLRLKQEEEDSIKRSLLEKKIKEWEVERMETFEAHNDKVRLLGNSLCTIENQVKLLKEQLAKRKSSDVSELSPPNES